MCDRDYYDRANYRKTFEEIWNRLRELKIADKTCVNSYLIIPFDTKAGAITIPQGQYAALKDEDGSVYFSVENDLGTKVESCALCDTIEYLKIKRSNPKSLCAVTNFNLESCAETDSISYVVTQKSKTTEGICTPSLVYFGRTGDILKFAINDCSTISKPTLSYDLKLGDTVRFLDEQIKVVSADNLGIYYSPLSKPTLKNNDVVDAKVTATLLKSKKLQLQECKTLENEQEHTETAKTSTLDSAKLKDSDTAQTNSTQNTDNSQVNRAKTN